MTYFGGLGAGKGWSKFKFVLTPDELKKNFEGLYYWFVVTNRRVDIDYLVNDQTSLFDHYTTYFNKMTSGQPWNSKVDWQNKSGLRLSITGDPTIIKFAEIRDSNGKLSSEFKLVKPREPVINVSPFYLLYDEDKLTIEAMNEEGILGLEIAFPKFVTLSSEGHEWIHDTAGYSNRKLFDELTTRIKTVTGRSILGSQTKTFRPDFWISRDSIGLVNRNYYLIKNRLRLN